MSKRKFVSEWKFVKNGRMLAGLVGSRGHKTKQCRTVNELLALARDVFGINGHDIHTVLCQIRDLQAAGVYWNPEKRSPPENIFPMNIPRSKGPTQKEIKEFYESWAWKRLRYGFIKSKQRRCECCGATPQDGCRIVVDHIRPIRRYWDWRLNITNLQLLCDDCNRGKGSQDTTDWRPSGNLADEE